MFAPAAGFGVAPIRGGVVVVVVVFNVAVVVVVVLLVIVVGTFVMVSCVTSGKMP